jgi:hypothetical protein
MHFYGFFFEQRRQARGLIPLLSAASSLAEFD